MALKNSGKTAAVFIAAFFVLLFQTCDVFFIHTQGSLFGSNVIARLAGLGVFIIASLLLKFNIRNFCFRQYGFVFEILIGVLYAVIPAAIVYGAEYTVLLTKGYENLHLNISFPNTNDAMSFKGTLLAIGLFMFTVLLQSLFKELFFRGFVITQLFDKFGLRKSNVIQAVLYTLLLVPTILQYIISGRFRGYGWQMTAFIIVCNLFIDFISALKWGMFYRVNGTVWMSTADHFVNNMLLTCVYITYGMMPMKWYVIQAVLVQIISFVMFIPLYFKRDRQNEEIAAEMAVQRELAGLPVDNYSPSPVRHFVENKRFEKQTEIAKKRNMPPPKKNIRFPEDLEEPVSLQDAGFLPADRLAASVEVIGINDNAAEENPDGISPVESTPAEMSEAFFENIKQKALKTDVDITSGMKEEDAKETDGVSESGNNISKLVQGYFEENFNKHTF